MKKYILITGATGFLGSNLAQRLYEENYDIILLKRSFSDTSKISNIIEKVKTYDIDKVDDFSSIFSNEITTIIHTATSYGKSDTNTKNINKSNVIFPLKLLESAVEFNVENFINTDTFYRNNFEAAPQNLKNYTASKEEFYQTMQAYKAVIKIINIKLHHIYGKNDSLEKFIPNMINRFQNNETDITIKNGSQKRDFIYLEDAISGFLSVIENTHKLASQNNEFELGSGKQVSIEQIIKTIKAVTKSQSSITFEQETKNIDFMSANTTELQKLGWNPKFSVKDGISQIINPH